MNVFGKSQVQRPSIWGIQKFEKQYIRETAENMSINLFGQIVKKGRRISRTVWREIRTNYFGQTFPQKPKTLNLLVNDICNSRCQMCLIWQQKRKKEFSPDELRQILSDSLYDRLSYIGVSGGEPTLRQDLPEIYQVLVDKSPRIQGTGIITNAIQEDTVITRIHQSAQVCQQADVPFNIMVSLDGVGEVHDHVRGRKGNFKSVMKVIQHFQEKTDIPISFGATITKDNVWYVDELLDFAQREKLYGRFRIAEFIQRLYNDEQGQYIRSFSDEESYHLALFFERLIREYETSPVFKRTYRNIQGMLLGEKRMIRCPYQSNAVVLGSQGNLLYCSPKSPALGNALNVSSDELYTRNISVRRSIIKHHCQSCIHDYHASPTMSTIFSSFKKRYYRKQFRLEKALNHSVSLRKQRPASSLSLFQSAYIIGWYGTETAGDKAILGALIDRLFQTGVHKIAVSSLTPFITRQTLKELAYSTIDVIPVYSSEYLQRARDMDVTIMGGGPIMEIKALEIVLKAFSEAKKHGNFTWIAGCGIGPLYSPLYTKAVKQLIQLTDRLELRDDASVDWVLTNTSHSGPINTGDPAVHFVNRWKKNRKDLPEKSQTLNCYLREWSIEYNATLPQKTFALQKQQFEEQLALWVREICTKFQLRPRLMPMHHFSIGGDDRIFNRQFTNTYLSDLAPIVEIRPLSVDELLQSMLEAQMCITMRFHSTLFANTLGVPFFAIDYTGGGKVYNYLSDNAKLDVLISLQDIAKGKWQEFPSYKALNSFLS